MRADRDDRNMALAYAPKQLWNHEELLLHLIDDMDGDNYDGEDEYGPYGDGKRGFIVSSSQFTPGKPFIWSL